MAEDGVENGDEILTVREVATILKISEPGVRRVSSQKKQVGTIYAAKIGKLWRYRRRDVDDFRKWLWETGDET